MERIWLKHYPAGVPADIDPNKYRSIRDLFEESVASFRDRPAYYCMGKELTFGDIDRMSTAFGEWLQAQGLQKGDRVALMMPNALQYPVALFGILRAGMVVVNINPLYTPTELRHQLADSGASAIVIMANFAHTLELAAQDIPLGHVIVTQLGDHFPWPKRTAIYLTLKYIKRKQPAFSLPAAIPYRRVLRQGRQMAFTQPYIAP